MSEQYMEQPEPLAFPAWATLDKLARQSQEYAFAECPPYADNMVSGMGQGRFWKEHDGSTVAIRFTATSDSKPLETIEDLLDEDRQAHHSYGVAYLKTSRLPSYPPELTQAASGLHDIAPLLSPPAPVTYSFMLNLAYDEKDLIWEIQRSYQLPGKPDRSVTVVLEEGGISAEEIEPAESDDIIGNSVATASDPTYAGRLRVLNGFMLLEALHSKNQILQIDTAPLFE